MSFFKKKSSKTKSISHKRIQREVAKVMQQLKSTGAGLSSEDLNKSSTAKTNPNNELTEAIATCSNEVDMSCYEPKL